MHMLTWKEGNDDMLSDIMKSVLIIISANKDSTEDHVFWPNAINIIIQIISSPFSMFQSQV